jgi:transposase InsO family protein
MNAEMKEYILKCSICRSHEDSQQKETLMSHEVPDRPWSKVGTDLFMVDGVDYLITVDYYSNFWEVDQLSDTESRTIIKKLKSHFARYGIPDQVISDNGPQYSSTSFAKFAAAWDFEHLTSSPGHSQSNGKAESAVKTAKKLIKRAKEAKADIHLAILDHRNTPTQGLGASPAQNLMNRRTKTLLPTSAKLLAPKVSYPQEAMKRGKAKQAYYYNQHAKDLTPLQEGEVVRMKPLRKGHDWKQATIIKRHDERSYEVETSEGTYRRNRVHLRQTQEPPMPAVNKAPNSHASPCDVEHAPTPGPPVHNTAAKSVPPPVLQQSPPVPKPDTPVKNQAVKITPSKTTRSGRTVIKPARFRDSS